MNDKDVTRLVEFGLPDDEALPLTQCVCGFRFKPWEFVLGVYRDHASLCPKCGRSLYFGISVKVYEVSEA